MTDSSVPHVCFEGRVTVQLASPSPTVICTRVSKNHRPVPFFSAAIVLCVAFSLCFSGISSHGRQTWELQTISNKKLQGTPNPLQQLKQKPCGGISELFFWWIMLLLFQWVKKIHIVHSTCTFLKQLSQNTTDEWGQTLLNRKHLPWLWCQHFCEFGSKHLILYFDIIFHLCTANERSSLCIKHIWMWKYFVYILISQKSVFIDLECPLWPGFVYFFSSIAFLLSFQDSLPLS